MGGGVVQNFVGKLFFVADEDSVYTSGPIIAKRRTPKIVEQVSW